MRLVVSGPVSLIFCLPTLPQRGITVGSSLSVAQEWMTPRGLMFLRKLGEILLRIVVVHLRLFLGIEVIEVAEELVEAVIGRQHVVQVAEVVLAELPGRVALVLQRRRDRDDLLVHADRRRRNADLRQPGAQHALPGDEGRAAGGARLLAVGVGEQHALLGDAVDVGRLVAHQPVRVAAQVRDADVVAPDDEDVRLLVAGLALGLPPFAILFLLAMERSPVTAIA